MIIGWLQSLGCSTSSALGGPYAMLRSTSAGETDISPFCPNSGRSCRRLRVFPRFWSSLPFGRLQHLAYYCTIVDLPWRLPDLQSACHCLIVSPDSGWPRPVALGTVAKAHAAAARWTYFPARHGWTAREEKFSTPKSLPTCLPVHVAPFVHFVPIPMSPNESMLHRRWTSIYVVAIKKARGHTITKARRHGIDMHSHCNNLLA